MGILDECEFAIGRDAQFLPDRNTQINFFGFASIYWNELDHAGARATVRQNDDRATVMDH